MVQRERLFLKAVAQRPGPPLLFSDIEEERDYGTGTGSPPKATVNYSQSFDFREWSQTQVCMDAVSGPLTTHHSV